MAERLVLVFCSFLVLVSSAVSAAQIRVNAPAEARLGRPFFVTVRAPGGLESLEVSWLGRTVSPEVRGDRAVVLLGVGLATEPGGHSLGVAAKTGDGPAAVTRKVVVKTRAYPEQHLKVARKMVHLSKEQLDRHYREKARVREVLDSASAERYWECPFERPVPGAMTSAYGLRRFFNGEPRKPHSGVDLRAAEGAPVKAFASGVTALAGEHYFSGNVVYLDHGQGFVSMYCHLSEIRVEEGRFVSKGEVLGLAGSTGRVTGPHLHFGVGVLGEMIDPLALLDTGCPKPLEED
jgi:murein DD-endopeptidase MepM/ murein hydrolase activator NlpD